MYDGGKGRRTVTRMTAAKGVLLGFLLCLFLLLVVSNLAPGSITGAVNGLADNPLGRQLRTFTETAPPRSPSMVEMDVLGLRLSQVDLQPLLILRQKGTDRRLTLGIGLAEANAIRVAMEGVHMPRPLTHDLLLSTLTTLGASVSYIVINDLREGTFYAKIVLSEGGRQIEMDSRPSDAVALALRAGVPVYTEQAVLDQAGGPRSPSEGEGSRSL